MLERLLGTRLLPPSLRAAALREYEALASLLRRELDVDPAEETRALLRP